MRHWVAALAVCIVLAVAGILFNGSAKSLFGREHAERAQFDDLVEDIWLPDFKPPAALPWLAKTGHTYLGIDKKTLTAFIEDVTSSTGVKVYLMTAGDGDDFDDPAAHTEAVSMLVRLPDDVSKRKLFWEKKDAFIASLGGPDHFDEITGNRWYDLGGGPHQPD